MTTIGLNPYARHLGDRDPLTVLRATVPALHERLRKLAPRVEVRPGPGRWSAREIVCHLADVESVHLVRLRQSLAEEHHVIQPFDQDRWAARYVGRDLATALAAFEATRAWLLAFAAELDDSDLARPVTHPERGTLSVRVLLETFAGHDLSHLRQLAQVDTALEGPRGPAGPEGPAPFRAEG